MKRIIFNQFRRALEFCGFDFDEVMNTHSRTRIYTDLRAIIWSICNKERHLVASQIGQMFGWNRSTVHCALERADILRMHDKYFSDMYDAIYGAYMAYEVQAKEEEEAQRRAEPIKMWYQ